MGFVKDVMKVRGEDRVLKGVFGKLNAEGKGRTSINIASTQIGQVSVVKEVMLISPYMMLWLYSKETGEHSRNSNKYKQELLIELGEDVENNFNSKIAEILFTIVGNISFDRSAFSDDADTLDPKKSTLNRHKHVQTAAKLFSSNFSEAATLYLLEVIVGASETEGTCMFEKIQHKFKANGKSVVSYISNINGSLFSDIAKLAREAYFPLPSTVKPIEWGVKEGVATGGYQNYQFDLVKVQGGYNYNNFSDEILEAVNYIQGNEWVVRKDVLKVIKGPQEAFKRRLYGRVCLP